MNAILALFKRETVIAWRTRAQSIAHLVFVLLMVTLFPFALGPDAVQLQHVAPGLLLLAILLGQMLGFEKLFSMDYQNGTLDIIHGSRMSLSFYAIVKSKAQWCALLLPIIVCSPLLMVLLHVPVMHMPVLILALLLASYIIQQLGMLGAALALGAKNAGLLLPLLLIPFYIPVMIFAVSLATAGAEGEGLQALYFLGALLVLYSSTLPFLTGAALRSAIEAS
ncbi:MAG: heme exporter protein CcmB [Alphaproteobacteria bacterium]|nr:heme exporter protein CcmB [Alphaproteobacteria bacterium]